MLTTRWFYRGHINAKVSKEVEVTLTVVEVSVEQPLESFFVTTSASGKKTGGEWERRSGRRHLILI